MNDTPRFIAGSECWADMGGFRMRYLRLAAREPAGRPPLVLVHGLLGYSFSWRHNLEALSADRDVYAVDLLGIGFSDRPPRNAVSYNLRDTARRMVDWMRGLGLRGADLVGTSHGGGVAILMAALDREEGTELISRLILVASINPWSKAGLRRTRVLAHPIGATVFRAVVPMFGIFTVAREIGLNRMYGDSSKITDEARRGYNAPIRLKGSVDYALGIVRHWHADLRVLQEAIRQINTIPALLIWGSKDIAVPVSSAHELKKHLNHSELVVLEGVGHLPYEESPEDFNRIVREFLH